MKRERKMVVVSLHFWTNDLELHCGERRPTVVWDSGMAKIQRNDSKGITDNDTRPFNCFEDILPLIKELFRKNKVYVVSDNRMPRVLSPRRRT